MNSAPHTADDAEVLEATLTQPFGEHVDAGLVGRKRRHDPFDDRFEGGVGDAAQLLEVRTRSGQRLGAQREILALAALEEIEIALTEIDEVPAEPMRALELEPGV